MVDIATRKWGWIGHVLRRDNTDNAKTALLWTPEGRGKIGRQRTAWRRTVEMELGGANLFRAEARKMATERSGWTRSVEVLCAQRHENDRWKSA